MMLSSHSNHSRGMWNPTTKQPSRSQVRYAAIVCTLIAVMMLCIICITHTTSTEKTAHQPEISIAETSNVQSTDRPKPDDLPPSPTPPYLPDQMHDDVVRSTTPSSSSSSQPTLAGVVTVGPSDWDPLVHDAECRHPHWSQDKEDWILFQQFFRRTSQDGKKSQIKRFGTVLEMGALDGVGLSNSLFYERCLQWRAILIEGQPSNCARLVRNRPRSNNLCMAICGPDDGTLQFTADPGPIAGAVDAMSNEFKDAFHSKHTIANTMAVPCGPLSKYLRLMGIRHLDFFSLDVEGSEIAVLETIDWTALTVDVMMVERDAWNKDGRNEKVRAILETKAGMTLWPGNLTPRSDLFVRKGFQDGNGYWDQMYA